MECLAFRGELQFLQLLRAFINYRQWPLPICPARHFALQLKFRANHNVPLPYYEFPRIPHFVFHFTTLTK